VAVADDRRGSDHGRLPPVHHFDVPIGGAVEWNLLFAYATIFLFWGFPNWKGYGIADMSSPWLTVVILAALCFFPVLGNLRPDLVSFLPSMRQYAGNWASAVWAFAPGAEAKLNRVTRSARNQVDQMVDFGYEPLWSEILVQHMIAWPAMHSQGRGMYSVLFEEPSGYRHQNGARRRDGLQLVDRVQLR
jgi:hypothetical protein